MIVHNVHNYANARLMKFVDHRFQFADAIDVVGTGKLRIPLFRNIIVFWIVAPIVADCPSRWWAGAIVEHRHNLDVRYPEVDQVIDSGGPAVNTSAMLHEAEELATLFGRNA